MAVSEQRAAAPAGHPHGGTARSTPMRVFLRRIRLPVVRDRLTPSRVSPALGFGELDTRAFRQSAVSPPVEFAEPQCRRDALAPAGSSLGGGWPQIPGPLMRSRNDRDLQRQAGDHHYILARFPDPNFIALDPRHGRSKIVFIVAVVTSFCPGHPGAGPRWRRVHDAHPWCAASAGCFRMLSARSCRLWQLRTLRQSFPGPHRQ